MFETLCRKLLAVAVLLNELVFERGNLAVEQIVGLVNQADERISPREWVVAFDPRLVEVMSLNIGEVRPISLMIARDFSDSLCFGIILVPLCSAALADVILIIEQQFVETGAGHVDESQFCLAGSGACP